MSCAKLLQTHGICLIPSRIKYSMMEYHLKISLYLYIFTVNW